MDLLILDLNNIYRNVLSDAGKWEKIKGYWSERKQIIRRRKEEQVLKTHEM